MTVQVLQSRMEIVRARAELRHQGLSCVTPWPLRVLRINGLWGGISVGDHLKSWDVLNTAKFVQTHVARSAPVLDVGGYGSEILCVLHRLGYSALTGVDLNPAIKQMPHAERIRYEVADFLHAPFPDESFAVITAISVIEHGFKSQPLLSEVSRLLHSRGYFVASCDYWPDKIATAGITLFGMDWRIFSRAEVLDFVDEARTYGLAPYGAVNLDAKEPVVAWTGKRYTFAWLIFEKTRGED